MKIVPDYLNGWKLVSDEEAEVVSVTNIDINTKPLRKENRTKTIDEFAALLPQAFCLYCNQEACEGGMVGSIQECETIIMLKDVIEELKEEMKGEQR